MQVVEQWPRFEKVVESNGTFEWSTSFLSAGKRGSGTALVGFPGGTTVKRVVFVVEANSAVHCNEVHLVKGENWRKHQVGAVLSDGTKYSSYCEDCQQSVAFGVGDQVEVILTKGVARVLVNQKEAAAFACSDTCTVSARVHAMGRMRIVL
jgi:hypothetical protein